MSGVVAGSRRPPGVLIAASILDSDLGDLADEIRRAEDAGADRIHLDVMDGHFVPNITFGWTMIAAVRRVTSLPFDAHLMIAEPGRWADRFIDAGCDSITFHVEVDAPQIRPALERIRGAGVSAGLSVKPGTALAALDAYRDLLDIVLVMTVEPGFGGQSFMAEVADAKLAAARAWLDPAGASEVQVDGGGKASTAEAIGRGGTDVIVAGSALYRADDMAAEVRRIRDIAAAARVGFVGAGISPVPGAPDAAAR
ncbi:MAG TPA: ribulose-phosphate 3-epimerase [Candidatus Limnocylindrales bacterium]|nr:ribulose-phosphate 3-epimerase [Candidatus Limnocylindrales bacterium]